MSAPSEMVKRVAKAIALANGVCDPKWAERQEREEYEAWWPEARAAIHAMREPTDVMMQAPAAGWVMVGDPAFLMSGHEAHEAWTAMIDEALK